MQKYIILVRKVGAEYFQPVGKPMSAKKADEAITALLGLRTTAEAKKEKEN